MLLPLKRRPKRPGGGRATGQHDRASEWDITHTTSIVFVRVCSIKLQLLRHVHLHLILKLLLDSACGQILRHGMAAAGSTANNLSTGSKQVKKPKWPKHAQQRTCLAIGSMELGCAYCSSEGFVRPMQRKGDAKRSEAADPPDGKAALDTTSSDRVPLPKTCFD